MKISDKKLMDGTVLSEEMKKMKSIDWSLARALIMSSKELLEKREL